MSRVTAERKRSQRVRFRRRYVNSVARDMGTRILQVSTVALSLGIFFYAAVAVTKFSKTTPLLRIAQVDYLNDIPKNLPAALALEANGRLFSFDESALAAQGLMQFPQLKELSIRRTWNRHVKVSGTYRVPVARVDRGGRAGFVDVDGNIFSLSSEESPPETEKLVTIQGATGSETLKPMLLGLERLRREVPEFYSLIKSAETDRMQIVRITLDDNVTVVWGEMKEQDVIERAQNLLRLRNEFSHGHKPATLRFVANDRVIVDANWTRIGANDRKAGG